MARRGGFRFSAAGGGRWLAGTGLAALALLPQTAMAQTAATGGQEAAASQAGASANNNQLGEIVVTARFVSEKLQDTPIAITTQTDVQLKAANVTGVSSLGKVVPNLYTMPGDSLAAGTPVIGFRGVLQGSGGNSSIAVPPAVAIYTDDVYHSTTAGSEINLADIDHIEVNRGPQSTLSGNASIAGSIKLYTVDPKGDNSGYAEIWGGSYKMVGGKAAIDLRLSDTLALRVSGDAERQGGYGDRLDYVCEQKKLGITSYLGNGNIPSIPQADAHDCVVGHTGGTQTASIQAKLRWRPTSTLDIILEARHHEEHNQETPEVVVSYIPVCFGGPPCTVSAAAQVYHQATLNTYGITTGNWFVPPARGNGVYDTYATNCRPAINTAGLNFPAGYPTNFCFQQSIPIHNDLGSAKIHWELADNINFTAIGAYTNYSNEFTQDADESPLGDSITHFYNYDHQYTGEARFDGKLFDNRLQWVVGGFLMRFTGHQTNMVSYYNIYQYSTVRGTNDTQSAFAHLDFSITDRWRISGGGRYTDGDIGITINNPQAVSVLTPSHSVQHRWDWLISSDYKFTDTIMGYVSAASGSRPPGLTTIVGTARQLAPTPAEDLISYEGGIKADLLDRHLRVNVDGFYEDYRKLSAGATGIECINQPGATATFFNVQQNTAAATQTCSQFPGAPNPIIWNINVGIPAKITGFEWEITAVPVDHLRFDWSGGYNHFKSGAAVGAPGYLYPGNHRQPDWNMHADLSYDIEAGNHGTFTPRLDWSWQSQADYNPAASTSAPAPLYIIKPYGLWNAQLAYKDPSDKWTATLEVTNLVNKYYHYQVFTGGVDTYTRVAPPREFKVSLRRNF